MNSFDIAICTITVVAVVTGFKSGLLRALATVGGYVIAMPMAVSLTPLLLPVLSGKLGDPLGEGLGQGLGQDQLLFFVVFLAIGLLFAAVFRFGVGELIGTDISLLDRIAGALLGAVRIGLVAMTLVLIFDRIIPPDRQPAFLRGSRLQPILLAAGRAGLKSLPPDVTAYIDQLKRERHI